MTIGENIKKLRKERGLTQKELGNLCQPPIDEANIRKYENDKQNPKIDTLKKIASALECEVSDIDEHIYIIPPYKPTPEHMEKLKQEAEVRKILSAYEAGKILTPEERQKINDYYKQSYFETTPREEVAKKAPKFTAYDEKGNIIKDGKAPKFKEPSMSIEEAIAEAEADELERLQNAYKRLNRKGKIKAVERVEELTEISRYIKEDPLLIFFLCFQRGKSNINDEDFHPPALAPTVAISTVMSVITGRVSTKWWTRSPQNCGNQPPQK